MTTEFQKLPRHCLLPVLPGAGAYQQHWKQDVDAAWNVPVMWIKEYSDKLSNYVVVTQRDPWLVEKVEKETGKQVIPTLCLAEADPMDVCLVVRPSLWKPTQKQRAWLEYLRSRVNDFPYIMASNCGNDMDTNTGSTPLSTHLAEFVQAFPDLANKFAYAPWDVSMNGEAVAYCNRLEQSPILNHFRAHKSLVCVYMAYTILYDSVQQYVADGYNLDGTVWLHAIQRRDPNWTPPGRPEFVHPYVALHQLYRQLSVPWRSGIDMQIVGPPEEPMTGKAVNTECVFSGIGFFTGASRHNLARMVQCGFSGCCFFPPAVDSDEGRRQMDMYTTDVL